MATPPPVKRDAHRAATQWWAEIIKLPGTVEEKAAQLAARYDELPPHVARKLTLDLIVASYPDGHPPPKALIKLLQHALGLPANHKVGRWPLIAGAWTDRGSPDHEARAMAALIDHEYIDQHGKHMQLRALERAVKAKLGRAPDRTSLRRWRAAQAYWRSDLKPPAGGGK